MTVVQERGAGLSGAGEPQAALVMSGDAGGMDRGEEPLHAARSVDVKRLSLWPPGVGQCPMLDGVTAVRIVEVGIGDALRDLDVEELSLIWRSGGEAMIAARLTASG